MDKQKIDKDFIDNLRLNYCTVIWNFDNAEANEIVPKELTHDYLLNNFNIDESIYKHYYLPTSNLLSNSEFQKMIESGFRGKKERALSPYSNIIYGAYYSRSDLLKKLAALENEDDKQRDYFPLQAKLTRPVYYKRCYTIEGREIKYFTDLIPYFKEYAKGFENGFKEFDNSQIKPFLTMLADKQDYVNKVFEFVTKHIFFTHGWGTLQKGFKTIHKGFIDNPKVEIIEAFSDGQEQGYFYRAWSIIFSNNKTFAPLFQEYSQLRQPVVKELPPLNTEIDTAKYTAKHYALAYLLECNAKCEIFPRGNKKELERIGNERMGEGKGNRFYKVFNEIIKKDLNVEKNLLEIGGDYWKKAVVELSEAPELVQKYLQNKEL